MVARTCVDHDQYFFLPHQLASARATRMLRTLAQYGIVYWSPFLVLSRPARWSQIGSMHVFQVFSDAPGPQYSGSICTFTCFGSRIGLFHP